MRRLKVQSIVEFVTQTDDLGKKADLVLYRGQSVRGNLLPSIARRDPARNTTAEEMRVLQQLRLRGASMIGHRGDTDLDLLVAAQHYGLMTRLLDWSGNPLVALWFACASKAEGSVYVYGLRSDNLLERDVYKGSPFTRRRTSVIQPRHSVERIVAQQGWFTLHRYSSRVGKFVALEKNPVMSPHLHEFEIPSQARPSMLRSLDAHGISAKTIFPHLDGLCQYLNWKHGLT